MENFLNFSTPQIPKKLYENFKEQNEFTKKLRIQRKQLNKLEAK